MVSRTRLPGVVIVALLMVAGPAWAEVNVWFNAQDSVVAVGDTVTVDLMANFTDSVVAWGLDLNMSDPGYAGLTDVAIDSAWDATDTLDEDGLAGLRFPVGLSGEVLLATLTFEGLAEGMTGLTLSDGPEEDEGFQLEFGGLDTSVTYAPGSITVVPEPGTLAIFGFGLLVLSSRPTGRTSSSH